jgi:hypothetical protein
VCAQCKRDGSFHADAEAWAFFPTVGTLVSSFIVVELSLPSQTVAAKVTVNHPVARSTTWALELHQTRWRCQTSPPPRRMNETTYEYTIPAPRGGITDLFVRAAVNSW